MCILAPTTSDMQKIFLAVNYGNDDDDDDNLWKFDFNRLKKANRADGWL